MHLFTVGTVVSLVLFPVSAIFLHMCRFLESRKGQVLVGLLVLSAGGITILHFSEAAKDPQNKRIWNAVLTFWVVFMARNIQRFAWQQNTVDAAVAAAPPPPVQTRTTGSEQVKRRNPRRAQCA